MRRHLLAGTISRRSQAAIGRSRRRVRISRVRGDYGEERRRGSSPGGDHAGQCLGAAVRAALAEAVLLGRIPRLASATGSGWAMPGHVRALKAVGAAINPVFAQQSIRRWGVAVGRRATVLDDATWGAFQAGWTKPVGGDADHLEQLDDIDDTVAAGRSTRSQGGSRP